MGFRFKLGERVRVTASGEEGFIQGRAEYDAHENSYYVHYKAGDGRAVENWWGESVIESIECGKQEDEKKTEDSFCGPGHEVHINDAYLIATGVKLRNQHGRLVSTYIIPGMPELD